jgi:hypothetical protein
MSGRGRTERLKSGLLNNNDLQESSWPSLDSIYDARDPDSKLLARRVKSFFPHCDCNYTINS